MIVCWPRTFQRALEAARPASAHPSWTGPSIVRAGSSSSPQTGPMNGSPQGWSERYWRPSSIAISARRPQAKRRYRSMSGPLGIALARSGRCSKYAW